MISNGCTGKVKTFSGHTGGSGMPFLNNNVHILCPDYLLVNVDGVVGEIYILYRQAAELTYSHPGVEKDINHFIVLAVAVIVMNEFQELLHLIQADRVP